MTKNYFLNALLGIAYVTSVACFMYFAPKVFGPTDTVLIPIAVLSLFVLSVCAMAFIFGYQPLKLYLEGEKKAPLELLVKTVATFAGFTVLLLASIFVSNFFLK